MAGTQRTAAPRAAWARAARASAAGLAALSVVVALAAPASASSPCWKGVVDDWLDNARVDGIYDVSCYQEAIRHLPADVQYYSSAATDITRALQAMLLDRGATAPATTRSQPVVPAPTTNGGGTRTTPRPSGGGPKPPGGTKTTSSVTAGGTTTPDPATSPRTTTPAPATTSASPRPATTPAPATTSASPRPATTQATTQATTGPLVDAINGIGPKKADAFPLPLIILAAIAGLLIAAGAAGFVIRRRQGRGLT